MDGTYRKGFEGNKEAPKMSCHEKIRYNDHSVASEVFIAMKDGMEFMGFECGDCKTKTHNQAPVTGIHHCWACAKPILILPAAIRNAMAVLRSELKGV